MLQFKSDLMFTNTKRWVHGARDACAPTLVFFHPGEDRVHAPLSVWVGPVDVALDKEWLRVMEAAHIFEICECVLCRCESFATTRETSANPK